MVYSELDSASITSELQVNCQCGKRYGLTLIGDKNYWRYNISQSEAAIEEVKRMLNDETVNFDTIINSMTGIARFDNGTIHVCFLLCQKRCYFDCTREKNGQLSVLNVYDVPQRRLDNA
jgi:hypothetical protein